ncbi:XVIPCD domain-containing protein [Lysobacter sp. CA196]|uniref:XVIPCD domain-containing protein n=1 Tax=Lysobacter sp. CA196 TaxID=3455606 RepID=UPI003F8CF2E2
MAGMNRQLDAAIDAFATQSGVTATQAEQLRRSLQADEALLRSLNDAARQGTLRSFAMESNQDDPVGRTDIASGTMRLPPAALSSPERGTATSLHTALKLQEMSLRFGNSEYVDSQGRTARVSQEMVSNLQQTLGASPLLLDRTEAAINARPEPHLKSFTVLAGDQGMGAAYDGDVKTMLIPAYRLQATTATNPRGFDKVTMVYAFAHEIQHGFNHERKQMAWREFKAEVRQIAKDDNSVNDYTQPVATIIRASRVDEAEGEIAGWNAVLSMKQKADPSFDLEGMKKIPGARPYLFVTAGSSNVEPVGRSGLRFNEDGSVTPSAENVEAMGKNYFDRASKKGLAESAERVGLGPHKESNYPNYYGRNAIEELITLDRKVAKTVGGVEPRMQLNMAVLGLEENLIERLGLRVDPHPQERQPYYDSSESPPVLRHFDHTRNGANLNQHIPVEPVADVLPVAAKPSDPRQPSHSDHRMYGQIRDLVLAQDQQHGRQWDQTSEHLTASLLALSKEAGLTRVDHVVFSQKTDQVAAGENVFIVQGQLNDPAHVRAHMKTDAAVQTPEAASFQKVEALNERSAQQALNTQQNYQAQEEVQKSSGMSR